MAKPKKKAEGQMCENHPDAVAVRIEHEADGTPHPLCAACPSIEKG